MRKIRLRLVILGLVAVYGVYLYNKDESLLPPLMDGDIVLQSTPDPQAIAIAVATVSPYTHTGIIKHTPQGIMVQQAAHTVGETPLKKWIDQGIGRRFSVYRHTALTPEQGKNVIEAARKYYGRRYDIFFTFANEEMYCSELPYLAYGDTDIAIGKIQKIRDLHVDNRFAKELIEQRWQRHPKCQTPGMTFEQCYEIVMEDELVSPASIAEDPHFERIFTNYF